MENPYALPFIKRSHLLRYAGTAALMLGTSLSVASAADITFTGTGLGASWFTPGNWSTGALPTSTGTATITPGRDVLFSSGTSTVDTFVIAGNSNLSLTGSTSLLNTGSFGPTANVHVRSGTLSITNRARVSGTFGNTIFGNGGTGVLVVDTGGTFNSGWARLGMNAGDVGVATVSGTGSYWLADSGLDVGVGGSGTLAILNGGTVRAGSFNNVGAGTGGQGTLTVSGTGSTWDSRGNSIFIGGGTNSSGSVLVENGGKIASDFIQGTIFLGNEVGSTGVLLQTGGTVTAGAIAIGSGTGTYRLEGGVLETAEFVEYNPGVGSYTLELASGTVRALSGNPLDAKLNTTLRQGTTSTISTSGSPLSSWSGVISGSGALIKIGTGTITFSGANTYTGSTTLNQGAILIGQNNALGSGTVTLTGNSSLGSAGGTWTIGNSIVVNSGFTGTLTGTTNLVLNGTISGAGSIRKIGTGTVTLGSNNTYTGSTNLSAGGLLFGNDNALNSGTLAITGNSSFGASGGSRTIANRVTIATGFTGTVVGASNLELSGTISGAGGLNKAGAGTLTLSSANSYTGNTTLAAGTLQVANANALVSSSTLVFNGGTMQGNGTAYSFSNSLSFAGNAGFSGSSNLTYSGNGTLGTAVRTFSVTNTGTTTLAGTLIGAGGGITKNGLGTLVLSGTNNSFTGKTTISSGTLVVTSLANLSANSSLGGPTTVANGTIDIGATGTSAALKYIGAGSTSNRVINQAGSTGGATLDASGSGALVLTGSVTSAASSKTLTLTGTSTALNTISGTIGNGSSGVVSLEKSGDGTWALSAANLYSGSTTISGGKLNIAASNNLGGASSAVVLGGASTSGTLAYTGNTASFTRGFTVNAGGGGVETATAGQTLTLSTGTIATAGRFTVSGSGNTAITSTISGTGSLQKSGSGRLAVSGSNSYTGGTTVASGTLSVQHNNALGTGAVNVGGGTLAVESGFGISNSVVLSGGTYLRTLNGSLINAVNATSDLDGVDTTARIAAGATATPLTLTTSFSATSAATNDEIRRSDIYAFAGTDDGLFVLELSFASTADGSYLGWLDGDEWVNATVGNTGNNATGDMLNYQGTFAEFQLEYGNSLGSYVGAYGVDISGGVTTTWAVINHNSEFSVIPEPGTAALFATGLAIFALRRRRARA